MDQFLGTICAFGFNFAPYQWALCQGQLLSVSQNTALFSLLGTSYGGDGRVTFGLPNLQGTTAIGFGQGSGLSNYDIGQTGGTNSVTLNLNSLPAHTHALTVQMKANDSRAGVNTPLNNFQNATPAGTLYNSRTTSGTVMGGSVTFGLGPSIGGANPISIERPYLVANYCIALFGYFPPRP